MPRIFILDLIGDSGTHNALITTTDESWYSWLKYCMFYIKVINCAAFVLHWIL